MENNLSETACVKQKEKCSITFKEFKIMLLIVLSTIGSYYCYDLPGSLQEVLMKFHNLTTSEFSLFYSIYSLPCIVISSFGGYLADSSFGLRKTTHCFIFLMTMGSAIFGVAAPCNSYSLMILGRFIYGCGQETVLGPCLTTYVFIWFKKGHASLIFSLSDNLSCLGTILTYSLSTRLFERISQHYTDGRALDITLMINSFVIIIPALSFLFISLQPTPNASDLGGQKGKLLDFLKFPKAFWILAFVNSCLGNAVYTFEQFSQVMFMTEYDLTDSEANQVVSSMNIIKISMAVIVGLMVDHCGRNLLFLIASVTFALVSHVLLYLHFNAYLCMTLLGVSYSLISSSLYPIFGHILNRCNYGLGYGIQNSLLNLSLFVYPIFAGKIIDAFGYNSAQLFYITLLSLGFVSLILIPLLDTESCLIVTMTPKQRLVREQRLLANSRRQVASEVNSMQPSYGTL